MVAECSVPMISALNKSQFPFAYQTIKERWPNIITKVIDVIHRQRHAVVAAFGESGDADVKATIHELSEMKYHMQTDKPLLEFSDQYEDVNTWKEAMKSWRNQTDDQAGLSWWHVPILYVECYMYRRIIGALSKTRHMKTFDPFGSQKQLSYVSSLKKIGQIGDYLAKLDKEKNETDEHHRRIHVQRMLEVALWGNKWDLSHSSGEQAQHNDKSPIDEVEELRDNILVDDLARVYDEIFLRKPAPKRVDIILDNAGLELFGDLALSELLLDSRLANKVVLHGKVIPWFASDATGTDFTWLLEMLLGSHEKSLTWFGEKLQERMTNGTLEFRTHHFWTSPYPFVEMQEKANDLYSDLRQSQLLIFKGDMNYRKLVGDRDWPFELPLKTALRGFNPAPLLTLRTVKAETIAGLTADALKMLKDKYGDDKKWMSTGEYAVVQLVNDRNEECHNQR